MRGSGQAWSDLADLRLAGGESLTEAETLPLREKLEQLAREDFQPCLAADRIERGNIHAARAQEMLNCLVIRGLLYARARFAGEEAFWGPVSREVASMIENREQIRVADLPADALRPVAKELLFDCPVPGIGEQVHLAVPRILGRAAMDAAGRLVDGMKVRKGDLRVNTVLARLLREAENRWRLVL